MKFYSVLEKQILLFSSPEPTIFNAWLFWFLFFLFSGKIPILFISYISVLETVY